MKCKICNYESNFIFSGTILKKYVIKYYHCNRCGFLQTENPYWLDEVYNNPINLTDTGLLYRNLYFMKITSVIIYFYFNKTSKFLDFAGGYGVFTRLMRDTGFDYFWEDKYTTNLLAKGFEFDITDRKLELVSTFESFEHFVNPIEEIERMLKYCSTILFSTDLLSKDIPLPNKWWYYGLEHGQHISFYQINTLKFIAKKYNLNLYSNNYNIHLLTKKRFNSKLFNFIIKLSTRGLFSLVKHNMTSKTQSDSDLLK